VLPGSSNWDAVCWETDDVLLEGITGVGSEALCGIACGEIVLEGGGGREARSSLGCIDEVNFFFGAQGWGHRRKV